MRLLAVAVSVLACASFADEWHDKARLTEAGDAARAKDQLPEAEAAYRAALTSGDGVDVNASRLASLLSQQGRCRGGTADVDTLMQVLRGDFGAARPALEANEKKTPPSGCWNTVMLQALVLAYRADGRADDAARVVEKASKHRCKALVDDELEGALASLVSSAQYPDRREALRTSAAKVLGARSPLLGSGKSSPAACSDALGARDRDRLGDAGDRALAKKNFVEAERLYRAALAVRLPSAEEVDRNTTQLARALVAQGRCESDDPTLAALIALHRGDLAGARVVAEASVHKLLSEPPLFTLFPEAFEFTLWVEGRAGEAREIEKSISGLRERAVRPDPLQNGLMHLNWVWMKPEFRAKNEQFAAEYLGANHPLLALYAAKRDGKKLPAPAACRALP